MPRKCSVLLLRWFMFALLSNEACKTRLRFCKRRCFEFACALSYECPHDSFVAVMCTCSALTCYDEPLVSRGATSTELPKFEFVQELKGLALPRVSHFGKIALTPGSRRLRSTLAAAPVL